MIYGIAWSDEAFGAAQAFMVDDPEGLVRVLDVIDALATDPRPPQAFSRGSTDFLRLRVGRLRVLYEVNDRLTRIDVIRLGRSG